MEEKSKPLQAEVSILRDFISHLIEAGVGRENAVNRAFDLSLELIQFSGGKEFPDMATPQEANERLKAALLLEKARSAEVR